MLMAYLAERVPARVFMPLAVALTLAGRGAEDGTAGVMIEAALAWMLLAQYRLWDDLADRRHDALAHPDRVLVRAASIRPAVALCLALAALSFGVAFVHDRSGVSASVMVCLAAAAGAWYARRRRGSALDDCVRLAKYPAMVLIVGGSRLLSHPARLFATATGVYAAACAYEAWHDPSSFGRSFHDR